MTPYDRGAAVRYAKRWATAANPASYDYEKNRGGLHQLRLQCVYAGSGVMNYTREVMGWILHDPTTRPQPGRGWTTSNNFMTPTGKYPPVRRLHAVSIAHLLPGDVVQLSLTEKRWNHSPWWCAAAQARPPASDVLIAARTTTTPTRPSDEYIN